MPIGEGLDHHLAASPTYKVCEQMFYLESCMPRVGYCRSGFKVIYPAAPCCAPTCEAEDDWVDARQSPRKLPLRRGGLLEQRIDGAPEADELAREGNR